MVRDTEHHPRIDLKHKHAINAKNEIDNTFYQKNQPLSQKMKHENAFHKEEFTNENSTIEPKNQPQECISQKSIHTWKNQQLNQKISYENANHKEEFTDEIQPLNQKINLINESPKEAT